MKVALTEIPTTGRQSELLHTQLNAEETEARSNSGNEKLVEVKPVVGTPFTIVRKQDEGEFNCFVAIGKNRITGMMTEEECERLIEEKDWMIITNAIIYLAGKIQEEHTQYEGEIKV